MKAFFTKLFLTLIVLLLIIGISALGVFYYMKYTEAQNLQSKLNTANLKLTDAEAKVAELESKAGTTSGNLTFSDSGLEFDVKYPSGWELSANTKLEDKTTFPVVITGYALILKKDTSTLTFSKLLGGVGDMGTIYKTSEFDVVELKDATGDSVDVLRVSEKGKNEWKYVTKVDCSDVPDESLVAAGDLCGAGGFFSGFGGVGASTARLVASDEKVIKEADQIVISTL